MIKAKIKYAVKSSFLFEWGYRFRKEKKKNKKLVCIYDKKIPNTYKKIIKRTHIEINPNNKFQYWIDEDLYFCHFENVLGNMPPKFSLVIDNSLNDLQELVENTPNDYGLRDTEQQFLEVVYNYIDRIIDELEECKRRFGDNENIVKAITCFSKMKDSKSSCLYDALQRILFWDSLFWQTGHKLVGLGRLDYILDRFSDEYVDDEKLFRETIREFLSTLHAKYYNYKSATLQGDIGQIIVLGGLNSDGSYLSNPFTTVFIEECANLHIPDPKCLLRVSKNTPISLIELSLDSFLSGIGGPVLANDDVIIPMLESLCDSHDKACNYAFSACWEPLSYGDSFGQNNFQNINFAKSVNNALDAIISEKEKTWEKLVELFYKNLDAQIDEICLYSNNKQWEIDPLFSLFTEGCLSSGKDISKGGAINNDFGILSVGFTNAVNSMLGIKRMVFDEGIYSIEELAQVRKDNFNSDLGYKVLRNIEDAGGYFGKQDNYIIDFCNDIIEHVSGQLAKRKNKYGGHYKFGLSSPAYIDIGKTTDATMDGRLNYEPFNTHISVLDKGISLTELLGFASKLKYKNNLVNGNVVDLVMNPTMVRDNYKKIISLFKTSIDIGVYEMQVNILGSKELIDAKDHPEKHKDLIVRVWGFSSYFNDLPENYKDVLIKRALLNEAR